MSTFDDSTSDMSGDLTSGGLFESLDGSADPADRAVGELLRSAKELFGSGPAPQIGEALARFIGTTTAAPEVVAATVGSRARWLPNAAAKVLLGVALATGSLTTAHAAGVVDFGLLFDGGGGVPVPMIEPPAPPNSGPLSTVIVGPESVVPDTTQVAQREPVTTVTENFDGAEPDEPAEPTEPDEPAESVERAEPAESVERAEPVEPVEAGSEQDE